MTQAQALARLNSGANVFLTGAPGSGKSYVLTRFIKQAQSKGKRVAVTATTGIAASLLGGVTLHSWSGLGARRWLSASDIARIIENECLCERLSSTQILIIDEISLLNKDTFTSLDGLLRAARGDFKPFGALQVVLSGDFFQLPPVSRGRVEYAFKSPSWNELKLSICYLNEQHRQSGDELSLILSALRERRFSRRELDLLMNRMNLEHKPTTRLLTHNRDVERVNDLELAKIKSSPRYFKMRLLGNRTEALKLANSILCPETLILKQGSAVMFVANDFKLGFANGTQGTVVGFRSGLPIVELAHSGLRLKVGAHVWKIEDDGIVVAEVAQLPLRLAWGLTIHKSQGMSLESAEIDLAHSFAYGMGYVALSRVKYYSGLYLSRLNTRSLQLDPAAYVFDRTIRPANLKSPNFAKVLMALMAAGASVDLLKLSSGLSADELETLLMHRSSGE